jgi:ribonuclease Z
VTVHYPASGANYFDRLRDASIYHRAAEIIPDPLPESPGMIMVHDTERFTLYAHILDHSVPTLGYRVQEKPGVTFLPEKLAEHGVVGEQISELRQLGTVQISGRTVRLEEVSVPRPGAAFAFVMDTRACEGARMLAHDADLLVMESTFSAADQELADEYAHCTSVDAAKTARDAGVKQLALTHFSQRYHSVDDHLAEARAIFANTIALKDLMRVTIPRRRAERT